MACYHPIPAYQEGSEQPRLWPPLGTANMTIQCTKCIGCLAARATQWANRCDHEARQWENNIFVTLTFDDAHLPTEAAEKPSRGNPGPHQRQYNAKGMLDEMALTHFLKRLRQRVARRDPRIRSDPQGNVKYFACGEYGDLNDRPHYHLCLFNIDFTDRYRVGKDLYESELLSELWGNGKASYGEYTGGAANYVAQYTLKKQGNNNDHDADGVWRPAPFLRVSLRPAIGYTWLEKYQEDLQHGYLVSNGHRGPIPRTYRERLKLQDPALAEEIAVRLANRAKTLHKGGDNTPERRLAAETIHKRKKQLTERRTL